MLEPNRSNLDDHDAHLARQRRISKLMTDPRFLTLFSSIFILLGVYNVTTGLRRIRDARAHNQRLVWYKQINLLTGTEYVLLALVFLLSVGNRNGTLPASLQGIIVPLYLILLLAAAVLA